MRTAQSLFVFVLLSITACTSFRPTNPDPRGVLRFKGEPKQAHIEINDTSLGPLHMFEKDGVLLRPGEHRVVVRAVGYFPLYQIVEIKASETTVLEIKLRREPD